ncbi:unnamed protein product [Adineta steineri]|uniref:Uncharacterized protein n=1 Tax=Adineta steineri TaxID=433720 RepID=A0A819NTA6_9BILA|nr:unnamed protein product [Adineta steineri]CAF4001637.1 unnamed protein product [Adineta steineri]
MADDFDPLKNQVNKSSQGLNQPNQNKPSNNVLIHRPSYTGAWKRRSAGGTDIQINTSSATELQTQHSINSPNLNSPKLPTSPLPPYSSIPQSPTSPIPSNVVNRVAQRQVSQPDQRQVNIVEQNPKPYWESGENSFDEWNQYQSTDTTGQASAYTPEEYYNYEKPYKKKGVSNKIDRLVQRFPALGKFYKQPPSPFSPGRGDTNGQFRFEQTSDSAYDHKATYELTENDLSLHERYTDKTRMECINLQVKDETQPVDISVNHTTNKIYLCDVGRGVVEIYDMNKTLEHVIGDSTMIDFRPTAITLGRDGTIIVSSHFSHCLHMYLPQKSANETNPYSYKQFKLGIEGTHIHEFYQPAGICIDSITGYLYICDRGNYRIQVMTPEGICERVIELFLNSKKKFRLDPVRIALQNHSDHIVCIIGEGDSICLIPKYSNGRVYIDPFYVIDENGLGIKNAAGLALDAQDRIFISDTGHNRIVICAPDGTYITSFSTEGSELGQLQRPCGLDVTNDGAVVVTDPGNKRLHIFGAISKENDSSNTNTNDSNN